MTGFLAQERRHRRTREARRPAGRMRPTHLTTTYGYLVDVAITLSESKIRGNMRSRVMPVPVSADSPGQVNPPRFGGSRGRHESSRYKPRGPVSAFEKHLSELHHEEQLALEGYAKRIDYLHLVVDEERGSVSGDSERDFWDFVHRHPFAEPGQIVVTNEGHLRLVLKGKDEAHIGIRFLGNRRVRYVIFNRRAGERVLLETSGEDGFEGLVSHAHACGLQVFRA